MWSSTLDCAMVCLAVLEEFKVGHGILVKVHQGTEIRKMAPRAFSLQGASSVPFAHKSRAIDGTKCSVTMRPVISPLAFVSVGNGPTNCQMRRPNSGLLNTM